MSRTTSAVAASIAAFSLLLAGCGDDSSSSSASASSAASSSSAALAGAVDTAKAGAFVVGYKNSFPQLAAGRSDAQITEILGKVCADVKAGKAEDAVVTAVVDYGKNGSTTPTQPEALAIYQVAKGLCG